jgi:hypothetical protein
MTGLSLQTKHILFASLLLSQLHAELSNTVSNTNFTVANDDYACNYNRLRLELTASKENFFALSSFDLVNYLGNEYVNSTAFSYIKMQKADIAWGAQTNYKDYNGGSVYAKLYRLYGGYEDNNNRFVLGVQNIPMGVGRLWQPTNIFNPPNTYAFEPDEIYGVLAANYTRYLNDTSNLTCVASQKNDHSYKYAARFKSYIQIADVALNLVNSNAVKLAGYEIEGDLADTGVELRSEGAYIKTDDFSFEQAIFGADYGFVNGLNLTLEARYSSKTFSYEEIAQNQQNELAANLTHDPFSIGMSLAYDVNIFLGASLLYIENFNHANSRFIAPALTYTLNDYNSFTLGMFLYDGYESNLVQLLSNNYYLKYSVNF